MTPFFDDAGNEINPHLIPKPGLCVTCRKDDDPNEEILCTLTRMDQRGEKKFKCSAYKKNIYDYQPTGLYY